MRRILIVKQISTAFTYIIEYNPNVAFYQNLNYEYKFVSDPCFICNPEIDSKPSILLIG